MEMGLKQKKMEMFEVRILERTLCGNQRRFFFPYYAFICHEKQLTDHYFKILRSLICVSLALTNKSLEINNA